MNKKFFIFLLALAGIVSCSKTIEKDLVVEEQGEYDPVIHFGLETCTEPDALPQTKTEYSGETVVVGNKRYERINWVTTAGEEDRVQILSNKGVNKNLDKKVEYKVVANTSTNRPGFASSEAEASPVVSGSELYWEASTASHVFFSLYPSPASVASGNVSFALNPADADTTASVKISIPTVQTYKKRTNPAGPTGLGGHKAYEFEPVMDSAFMYAAARVAGKHVGYKKVPLRYKPLFSAFKFYFFAGDGTATDPKSRDFQITKVTLSSDESLGGSYLSGAFSAKIQAPGTDNVTASFEGGVVSNGKRSVSLEIPEADRVALGQDTVVVTLLALPVDQKFLTVDVTFLDGAGDERHRVMHMQKKDNMNVDGNEGKGWYELPKTRKLYVRSGIPDIEYVFKVAPKDPKYKFPKEGESITDYYNVVSYRKLWDRKNQREIIEEWPWEVTSYMYNYETTKNRPNDFSLEKYKDIGPFRSGPAYDDAANRTSLYDDFDAGKYYESTMGENKEGVVWDNFDNGRKDLADPYDTLGSYKARNLGNYDIYGNPYPGHDVKDPIPYETANCYIVTAPGWYKIPAVYGNGYRKGKINRKVFEKMGYSLGQGSDLLPFPHRGRYTSQSGGNSPDGINWFSDMRIWGPWISVPREASDGYVYGDPGAGEPNAGSGVGCSDNGNPHVDNVYVLWEDAQGLVQVHPDQRIATDMIGSNPTPFERHYIYFYVNPDAGNGTGGNAVIAVSTNNGEGNVYWSWHIWVVPKSRLVSTVTGNKIGTQQVWYRTQPNRRDFAYDSGSRTLTINDLKSDGDPSVLAVNEMMNMNLGYVDGIPNRSIIAEFTQMSSGKKQYLPFVQGGDSDAVGVVHYQWGRKDPMWTVGNTGEKHIFWYRKNAIINDRVAHETQPLPNDPHSEGMAWYSADYGWDSWTNFNYNYGTTNYRNNLGLSWSIQYPDRFFSSSNGAYAWSTKRFDNLWDLSITSAASDEDEHIDHNVVKTLFDPCPPGFKVPNEYAFTGFNKIGIDEQVPNDANPTEYINGLEPSFYIGNNGSGTLESEGMWLYCHPTDPSKGVIYFPAAGRRQGFSNDIFDENESYVDYVAPGEVYNLFEEGMYWTAAPFVSGTSIYGRVFHMRRNTQDVDPSKRPQCFPVYTRAATPSGQPYTGFMRSHGFQVRPIRDNDAIIPGGSTSGPNVGRGQFLGDGIDLDNDAL
ncbi:MAG: hypothetical protein J6M23_04600 [Bacteroidales bacterium]|nr:hypothetical protein [Bacteroidales bacterium]